MKDGVQCVVLRVRLVLFIGYSSLAQSVEHAAVNRSVVGSSPTGGAKETVNIVLAVFYFRFQIEIKSKSRLKV